MATRTTNYGLYKPDPTDNYEDFLPEFNANMDEIDNNLGGGGGGGDTVAWTQIQATGEKIAEITINGTITDVLIPFEAKIIVTTTTGLTVTATKGGTTYTAIETSTGVYEVTVYSKGTWTVTDGTNTITVSVTAQTTYNVAFVVIPDGSTVTPTDNIQIWLNCANIWDKAYTTLAEVLADSTTLSALISDNNATDYLVRSTTWASGMCADSTTMSYIGLNNYCANTLLADSTWCNAICNSTYFESVLNVKVPVMTSNTTPSGICSATLETGGLAYKAFDGNLGTYWATSSTTSGTVYYEFTRAVTIYLMTYAGYGSGYGANSVSFVDGNNTVIKTQSMQNITGAQKVYIGPNSYSNRKYGCRVNSTFNNQQASAMEAQFYGREDV